MVKIRLCIAVAYRRRQCRSVPRAVRKDPITGVRAGKYVRLSGRYSSVRRDESARDGCVRRKTDAEASTPPHSEGHASAVHWVSRPTFLPSPLHLVL
ncbi:hypothetical protein MRX96_044517 [Rhipicephalus microplus]